MISGRPHQVGAQTQQQEDDVSGPDIARTAPAETAGTVTAETVAAETATADTAASDPYSPASLVDDADLRASIRRLGDLLGETLVRQHGPELLEQVEEIRARTKEGADVAGLLAELADADP